MQLTKKFAVTLYLFTATAVGYVLVLATGTVDYYRLAKESDSTIGIVVGKNCSEHMFFEYQFEANKKPFRNKDSSSECHSIRVGDAVTVRYLASDPSINTASDPSYELKNNFVPILLAAFWVPFFLAFAIYIFVQRHK